MQFGDGGVRFPLRPLNTGPLNTVGKRQAKTKENEGKSLKQRENGGKFGEKLNGKLGKTKEIEETVGKMGNLQEGTAGKTVGT